MSGCSLKSPNIGLLEVNISEGLWIVRVRQFADLRYFK
jgi:hypothetical protein